MTAKIDDLLDSRPKPCICTIQRIEENEQQFLLHLDSFDAIEHLENSMKDQQSRQQMVTVNIQFLLFPFATFNFFSDPFAAPYRWNKSPENGLCNNGKVILIRNWN